VFSLASQVVIFSLGQEEYGMPIGVVREITRLGDIRPIPQSPNYVKGLINIRGTAIPLIDLHIRFGVESSGKVSGMEDSLTENLFALITEVDNNLIGFAVDQVKEVRVLENIAPPPPLVTSAFIDGIVNLPDRIIMLVNPERILESDELHGLSHMV
jgi:purine-binding chemotaxis protein CheW